jgi:hypothetical protein
MTDPPALTAATLTALHDPHDPARLLEHLAQLRRHRDAVDAQMRHLVAYAREYVKPRPYRLADLADAVGLSTSGLRLYYGPDHVAAVGHLLADAIQHLHSSDQLGDDEIDDVEGSLLDAGGYLPCGCHGSQRDHTCIPFD